MLVAERTGDHEWRVEGEEAEAFLYVADETVLDYSRLRAGVEAATRLPGVEGAVYAAASELDSGWVVSSSSHVAPGLVSAPGVGLLLLASSPLTKLGIPPEELPRLLSRCLSEVSMPALGEGALYSACEAGARWAAGEGLIEEEDLERLGMGDIRGEPDALGRRALAAGLREWDPRPEAAARALGVREILDHEAVESLGLYEGALVLEAYVSAGELGRLALEGHRQRIASRDFGDSERLVAAPSGTEEAADLVAAASVAANYAMARASLLLYALRRAMLEVAGRLGLVACWTTGGLEERNGTTVHRHSLARLERGEPLACGDTLARGTGAMLDSAPLFQPTDAGDKSWWPWEEAGLLERVSLLEDTGRRQDG